MSAVSTQSLLDFLPHRPPMVWVDEVLEASDQGGECLTYVKGSRPFLVDNRLKPHACVELMAQAFGFSQALHFQMSPGKKAPSRAYLAGIRDFRILENTVTSDRLQIRVQVEKILGPLALVRGTVSTPEGRLVAEGSLKLFAE